MSHGLEIEGWSRDLDELGGWLGRHFLRSEPRRRVLAYLRGLMAPLERKNGWQLAEAAGDRTPDGMQEFLSRARWDADLVRDDLQRYAIEHLGDDQAVLVLDETGFLKKGIKSVGVQRQYSGTAGRIENCQIGVFLSYASCHGHTLIDRALYLPESWTEDRVRCEEAAVPASVDFATKPELGHAMLVRAFDAEIPCAWVSGDCVYGGDHRLRRLIEAHGRGYVLAVRSNHVFEGTDVRRFVGQLTAKDWHRLSAGDGMKGPRLYDWALVPARSPTPTANGWQQGLLIRRAIADPSELAFYLIHAPAVTPLADLVRVAGRRWTIEACFEAAKGEVGLDHYEVRSWVGWHRHVTLAMLAHTYLTVLRKAAAGGRFEHRSADRAPASDRTRTAPPRLAFGLGTTTRSQQHHRLVDMATTPPATRKAMSLANA
jgi:SRSO17 transposase